MRYYEKDYYVTKEVNSYHACYKYVVYAIEASTDDESDFEHHKKVKYFSEHEFSDQAEEAAIEHLHKLLKLQSEL